MNELVLFIHILLIFIRCIGLIMSIEFYFRKRKTESIFSTFGWLVWVLGMLFAIFYAYNNNPLLSGWIVLFIRIFGTFGFFLLTFGFFYYFLKPPKKLIVLVISYMFFVPIMFYILIDLNMAIILATMPVNLTMFTVFFIPLFKRELFKEKLGKAIRWYYIMLILGFSYMLITIYLSAKYNNNWIYDPNPDFIDVTLNYIVLIVATVLIILMTFNIEYTISSREKSELKDKYSHNLGNIMQALYGVEYIIESESEFENFEDSVDMFKNKLEEASNLIAEIRKL